MERVLTVQPGCTKPRSYLRKDSNSKSSATFRAKKQNLGRSCISKGMMLGTDKSRGYCLEMICADFLAGANLQDIEP
jgi:hypothetical protein